MSLKLHQVSKTYGGQVQALAPLDLELLQQEFLVLVGPSGCGKSTLLRIIAGLEDPSSGSLELHQQDITRTSPKDRDLAMVFQNYALYPHMNVFQNMAFGLKMKKMPKHEIESRVLEVAETLGLSPLLQRRPAALSGGQQQRVALGRAIVKRPKLFLFDEPLSNLDAAMRLEMRREIALLHRQLQTPSIYVTHDQAEAMTLGDRILVLHQGQKQQLGSPDELYHSPDNLFVAQFLGSPPINTFSGHLKVEDTKAFFIAEGEKFSLPGIPSETTSSSWTLGIRPEHIQLASNSDKAFTQGQVEVVENMGHEFHISIRLKHQSIWMRYQGLNPPQQQETISIQFIQEKILLFNEKGARTPFSATLSSS